MAEQITIYPSEELMKLIKARADDEKRSVSNFIIFILESELKGGKKK